MLKKNESIVLTRREAIEVLSDVEYMLISLRNIARYYYHQEDLNPDLVDRLAYERETAKFIEEGNIAERLSNIRNIISDKFDDHLGTDDVDDIERVVEKIKYWTSPAD